MKGTLIRDQPLTNHNGRDGSEALDTAVHGRYFDSRISSLWVHSATEYLSMRNLATVRRARDNGFDHMGITRVKSSPSHCVRRLRCPILASTYALLASLGPTAMLASADGLSLRFHRDQTCGPSTRFLSMRGGTNTDDHWIRRVVKLPRSLWEIFLS
jgi:hypothetical protein